MHLRAARRLMERISFATMMRDLGVDDESYEAYDNVGFWAELLEQSDIGDTAPEQVLADARNFRDLEALVRALDSLEDMASYAQVAKEYDKPYQDMYTETDEDSVPGGQRSFWNQVADSAKATQESMEPLLKDWLMPGIKGECFPYWTRSWGAMNANTCNATTDGDTELGELRQAYLPETVLAYISALHFTGTGLSRDWLLECMNLASVVSETKSDLEATFVEAKRVRELLEALAASSRALAIVTGEKRAAGPGGKKLREKGWSRDLWLVKP